MAFTRVYHRYGQPVELAHAVAHENFAVGDALAREDGTKLKKASSDDVIVGVAASKGTANESFTFYPVSRDVVFEVETHTTDYTEADHRWITCDLRSEGDVNPGATTNNDVTIIDGPKHRSGTVQVIFTGKPAF